MNCILGMFASENMIGSVATKFVVQALKAAILEITDRSGGVFSPLLASNEAPEAGFSQDSQPGLFSMDHIMIDQIEIHLIKDLQGSV